MEQWDYIRFVYETESSMAIGGVAVLTPNPYTPSEPDWPDPGPDATPGGGVDQNQPASPENTKGKDQEKAVLSGGTIVAPCWLMNEAEGINGWMENGVWHSYTGETTLTRGPADRIRVRHGWGTHGDGFSPDLYQGYIIEALDEQGRVLCFAYGWDGGPRCRHNSEFPLGAPECSGESIGGDPSRVDANLGPTMWQRFEDTCLRELYPDCGPIENEGDD